MLSKSHYISISYCRSTDDRAVGSDDESHSDKHIATIASLVFTELIAAALQSIPARAPVEWTQCTI